MSDDTAAAALEPDTKDWTWTITRPCPECGFDGTSIERGDIPDLIRSYAMGMAAALARPGAAERPSPTTWSALEYGCHVRDVCRLFDQRAQLMLSENDPRFANWDQDATAVEHRYADQQPSTVAAELAAEASDLAATFRQVTAQEWDRPGRRSNGSSFTVETLGVYVLHDLAHHAFDVAPRKSRPGAQPRRAGGTIRS